MTSLIPPVLALIGWTFVMWVWLYATRIPALRAARVDLVAISRTGAKLDLPPEVSRVADNYNHLHEQPTLFYALALAAQVASAVDGISVALAWGYVGLRVDHAQRDHGAVLRVRGRVAGPAAAPRTHGLVAGLAVRAGVPAGSRNPSELSAPPATERCTVFLSRRCRRMVRPSTVSIRNATRRDAKQTSFTGG